MNHPIAAGAPTTDQWWCPIHQHPHAVPSLVTDCLNRHTNQQEGDTSDRLPQPHD